MTMGGPVVVSNGGALPEIACGKHLIFEYKNVKDLAEKVVAAQKSEYLVTPIKRFEWEKSIQAYLEIYAHLLKRAKRSKS